MSGTTYFLSDTVVSYYFVQKTVISLLISSCSPISLAEKGVEFFFKGGIKLKQRK